jgi:hypothetical protein
MNLFEQLSKNKGTVSSALGKALAQQVLTENQMGLLLECVELTAYAPSQPAAKSIRAGAAKVVEIVAEKRPELVAPHLEKLLPALSMPEPQTRWMVIRVMGFCAGLNPAIALRAVPYAEKYLKAKEGLVIASSADLFLGDLGAVSQKAAQKVFPVLEQSMENPIANEPDWLLEAGYKLYPNLSQARQATVRKFAERCQAMPRKSTQQRAKKILRLV